MRYKDNFETLDSKTFEQMAKEYYQKNLNFNNVSVLKFDLNNVFKSQFEQVLNIIYAINLKQTRHNFDKIYNKNLSYSLQLDCLNKQMFDLYKQIYGKVYLMPIATKINFNSKKENILNDYFRLIRALIDCDFYMLEDKNKAVFKDNIVKYFKLIFKMFS